MTEALAWVIPFSQEWLTAAFVVFLRVGAAMALFPAFGERSVPERVRLARGLAFTLVILPAVVLALRPLLAAH